MGYMVERKTPLTYVERKHKEDNRDFMCLYKHYICQI